MFSAEEGAWEIIEKSKAKYEKHFEQEFPVYEYLDMTKSEDADFSVDGAKRLSRFIDESISKNEPVPIPDDYENRLY